MGATAGGIIGNPSTYGLDFVLTAVFLTFAVGFWEGTETVLPWGVAAVTAALGTLWLPGRWYVLLGGLAASIVKMIQYD